MNSKSIDNALTGSDGRRASTGVPGLDDVLNGGFIPHRLYLVDGDPGAYVRYDSWPACAYTEIELTPDGSARLIRLNVSDHLSSILAS